MPQLVRWNATKATLEAVIGDDGPAGSVGPRGAQGLTGLTGTTGAAGTAFSVVSATPSNATGNNGDSALNLITGAILQKSAGTWSQVGTLVLSALTENVNTVAASGSAVTLPDSSVATMHDITLTANCAITLPTPSAGRSFLLKLTQGGSGNFAPTFVGTVKSPSGTLPSFSTVAGKYDLISFISVSGSSWNCLTVGTDMR